MTNDKEVTILNRTLKHTGDGLEYSADPRHEREIRAEFNIGRESKGLNAPAIKVELAKYGFSDELRDDAEAGRRSLAEGTVEAKLARTLCHRTGYDVQFASKD